MRGATLAALAFALSPPPLAAIASCHRPERREPVVRTHPKIGRNEPCWCGSGRKHKKCHLRGGR